MPQGDDSGTHFSNADSRQEGNLNDLIDILYASEQEVQALRRTLTQERAKNVFASATKETADPVVSRGDAILKVLVEVQTFGWEYQLASAEAWTTDHGESIRIGGHEATVRVPQGPEATVVAFSPEVALIAALRGVKAALAHQGPDGVKSDPGRW